jgi:Ni,Fe-hydrogenase I cytochrome b subunit
MGKKDKVKEPDRILLTGKPDYERCDNKVVSARYTLVTFFPVVRTRFAVYALFGNKKVVGIAYLLSVVFWLSVMMMSQFLDLSFLGALLPWFLCALVWVHLLIRSSMAAIDCPTLKRRHCWRVIFQLPSKNQPNLLAF